jgi:hypothetical protein
MLFFTDGSVVEAVGKEYGSENVTVRRVTDGATFVCKVSDLTCERGELQKAREIRPVRTPK